MVELRTLLDCSSLDEARMSTARTTTLHNSNSQAGPSFRSRTVTFVSIADQLNASAPSDAGRPVSTPIAGRIGKTDVGVTLEIGGDSGEAPDERELVLDLAAVLKTSPARFKVASQQRIGGRLPLLSPRVTNVSLVRQQVKGSSAPGVGLAIAKNDVSGRFVVEKLHPGCPAAESCQIFEQDVVHSINGTEITGLTYEEVTTMLVGPSGSTVDLQIFRDEYDTGPLDLTEDKFQREHKIHTVIYLNIFRDADEIDLRSAEFLSQILESQLRSPESSIKWAKSTSNISRIKIGPPHPNHIPVRSAPRLDPASSLQPTDGLNLSSILGVSSPNFSGGVASRSLSPENEPVSYTHINGSLDVGQRVLQTLVEGQRRTAQSENNNIPAVLNIVLSGTEEDLNDSQKICNEIGIEIATILFLDRDSFLVEPVTSPNSYRVTIFPCQTAEQSKGRQHLLASQLVAWILNNTSALSVQSINIQTKSGKTPQKQQSMIEYLLQTDSVSLENPDSYGTSNQTIENLRNSKLENSTKWVADSTLGVAWEQIDRNQEPRRYWVNHRDKLISLSHPSELVPMPEYYEQYVDDQRRLVYRNRLTQNASFLHPATSGIRCGVHVEGKSMACIMLRDWVELNGWSDLNSRLLEREKWANKAFTWSCSDTYYTQLFEKASTGNVIGGLVAEWCFSLRHDEMDKLVLSQNSSSFPVMALPVDEEQIPYMAVCCVETLLAFYPPFHYMLFRAILDYDEEDDIRVSCFQSAARAAKFHPKTKTNFDTSVLNICPDGYEILVVARNIDAADSKIIKYLLLYCGLPGHKTNQYGRAFVLWEDTIVRSLDELVVELNARRYHHYDSIESCICSFTEHQVRINPTAEHPTSRRIQNLNRCLDSNTDSVNELTSTKPGDVSFTNLIKISEEPPDLNFKVGSTKFDKVVVSIERTVAVKTDPDQIWYDVGIDVMEIQPGKFQVSSIHDDCSEAATALTIGDEIISIDGHEISLHSLTILALQAAGKKSSDNLTTAAVVRGMLQGSKGSLLTLILKRTDARPGLGLAKNVLSAPVKLPVHEMDEIESAAPLSAEPLKSRKKRDSTRQGARSRCLLQ